MELRDYQKDAIAKLKQALVAGHKRPVLHSPTGSGKTVIAASVVEMARQKGKRVIFAVPALSLIDQTVERFVSNGIIEIGVMQGDHELTDALRPVQVCSVQTLARRKIPKADLVIIDECHIQFRLFDKWMNDPEWQSVPFVGLSATPWAKGMGSKGRWDHLIIGTTTRELIDKGHLSNFKVYAPAHPDLSGVKTKAGDYDITELGGVMNTSALVADVVSTWMTKGENQPTICFAVDRTHAKHLQQMFAESGVPAEYMDAYTTLEQRAGIIKRFQDGHTKVICNVGVLTTGFDADVRCIILARPTRSEILYSQMIGRGLRTASGKDHCIILDHSDTTLRLGFVTDIHHDELDDGSGRRPQKERSAPLPKECPKCSFLKPPKTPICPACGFKPEGRDDTEVAEGELHELLDRKTAKVKSTSISEQITFYAEMRLHAEQRGFKHGWAYWAFKDKFKSSPPRSFDSATVNYIRPETQSWIRARNIRKSKAREKMGITNGKDRAASTGTLENAAAPARG